MSIPMGRVMGMAATMACALQRQYGGGTTGSGSTAGTANGAAFNRDYHISFERPEAWGLKYFASVSLLSVLPAREAGGPRSNDGLFSVRALPSCTFH